MGAVDSRVVQMTFDNKQFEKNVKTSLDTLDRLDRGIKLEGSAKGVANLSKLTNSFSLGGIAAGVDTIASKFTTLGIIGVTALQNITNSAVNAGKRITAALTIDPVSEGFADYNRKLTSVQTIMNATGKDIGVVNGYFNQLDTYADKTIYNLDDMTSALAKFTNAGVEMDKSVPAIKGIANMVALAGQDAGAAQIAMYNLSQSIAGGFLTTTDYKSLNLANVATKEWKDQMIQGAISAGTLKKTAKGLYIIKGTKDAVTDAALFNEELSKGWATTNVMLDVLGKYGDINTKIGAKAQASAQDVKSFSMMMDTLKASVGTGWTDTFEILVGNLNEAKQLFTPLTNFIGNFLSSVSDARNQMLQVWKDNGGRTALLESITNAFKGLMSVLKPIGEAFREVFPPMTGERLAELTKKLMDLTAKLTISGSTATIIKNIFKGLFSAIDIGIKIVVFLAKALGILIAPFAPLGKVILFLAGQVGKIITSFNDFLERTGVLNTALDKFRSFVKMVADGVGESVGKIIDSFGSFDGANLSGLDNFSEKVQTAFSPFEKLANFVTNVFSKIVAVVKKVASVLGLIFSKIGEYFKETFSGMGAMDFMKLIEGGAITVLITKVSGFITNISKFTKSSQKLVNSFRTIFANLGDCLKTFQAKIKADILMKIAISVGILSAALFALSLIAPEKLAMALGTITGLFADLFASMAVLQKILGKGGFENLYIVTAAMIGMAIAVAKLSTALVKLSKLSWLEIAKGMTGLIGACALLIGASRLMGKADADIVKMSASLVIFSVAVGALAKSLLEMTEVVKAFGEMDVNTLVKGMYALGIMMAELAMFLTVTKKNKLGAKQGAGIVLVALALKMLADVIQNLGAMDVKTLLKGLGTMYLMMEFISEFVTDMKDVTKLTSTATGLVILSAAMIILSSVVSKFGNMPIDTLAKGLIALSFSLGAITGAIALMPADMALKSVGLGAIAIAMMLLSDAIIKMGQMSLPEMAKALTMLAGSLFIMGSAVIFMDKAEPGAAVLILMAMALGMLVPVLKCFGSMSIPQIVKSLLMLLGVFTILGVAAIAVGPLVPALLGLAAVIGVLGIACALGGIGTLAFATGLTALAVAGTAGVGTLVLLIASLAGMIPLVAQKISQAIIIFAREIIKGGPVIGEAVKTILLEVGTAISTTLPIFVADVVSFLVQVLQTIADYTPQIVEAGCQVLLGILQGIANNIYQITDAAISIVVNFMNAIAARLPDLIQAGFNLMISFINGLADAITNNMERLLDAVRNLFGAIIKSAIATLIPGGEKLFEAGKEILCKLRDGIKNNIGGLVDVFTSIPKNCIDGLKVGFKGFYFIGRDIVEGIVKGIADNVSKIIDKIKQIASDCIDAIKNKLGIHSPSTEFAKIGKYCDEGLAVGLGQYSKLAASAAKDVGLDAMDAMNNSVSKISVGALESKPTIRPVVDISDVLRGSNQINSLLSSKQAMAISANISAAANKKSVSDSLSENIALINAQENTKIISAIERASNVINDFMSTFSGMSVVMDSGEIVGSIAPKMDLALGQTTMYKGRGI